MKWLAADFETSNSKINIEREYTRVWLWDIFDPETREHRNGYDIDSFIDYVFSLPSRIFYFHNLKFDGSFIIYFLLSYGFRVSDSKESGTISTLITDRLIWYTFTVYYHGRRYIFRDSAKKIIGSLEQAAKDFDLPIRKGEIQYDLHRDEGYIPTKEEIEYCHIDTEILADILQYYYDNGMSQMTNASDAMKAYKNMVTEKGYQRFFPVLPKPIDDFIRKSYKGGYCYLNPKWFNEDIHKVYCYDVKSMYPSVMYEKLLPYGIPLHYKGNYEYDEEYPLYIQEINVCCTLKENKVPSIQTKSFMSIKLNYLKTTNGKMLNLVLTSLDLERLIDDYYIEDIEYVQGFKFKGTTDLFKDYIGHYFPLKESSTGAKKQLYKIFLNSLYGKFAMMTERKKGIPEILNDHIKFQKTESEECDAMYTAVASFITSWARHKLLNGIYANYENFIYCDTDSMQLTAPVKGVDVGKNLGQWNIENGKYENGEAKTDINMARYLGQKCYILCKRKDDKEILIKKIAGAPAKVKEQINFSNFRINFTSDATQYPKFRQKNVKGGVILIPTEFTIKEKK